ncbi:MAG: sigma-70 family RNA polymerase sigma factor [Gemmataceae bacterium]|nr:sigma-70 family RNA polymerase sigma factor [Gemmataceae bacterium]
MPTANTFHDLVRQLKAGDDEAASALVQRYEAEIRRAVRVRLTDRFLRRTLDSVDICQSVLGNFFLRLKCGQIELDNPQKLLALLTKMAANKVIDHARKAKARLKDKALPGPAAEEALNTALDPHDTPAAQVENKDLAAEARRRLSPEERRLADLRIDGKEWGEIALEMGGTAEGRRKQFDRAMDRVAVELGPCSMEENAE